MKILNKIVVFSVLFMAWSCTQEELFNEETEEISGTSMLTAIDLPPSTNTPKYLTPGLVDFGSCLSADQRKYNAYVSTGPSGIVNYARNVELYIVKQSGGRSLIVDVALVTIPANSNVSNNVRVFDFGHPTRLGKVDVIIANVVRVGGGIDHDFMPRKTSPTVYNCIAQVINIDRYLFNDDDFDNDFIKNKYDSDDDNDGIPDDVDPDDDNDGNPDNRDTDDDNDGIPDNRDPDRR